MVILKLKWKDTDKAIYTLGNLYKANNLYHFDIDIDELKKATKNGCFGIGSIDLLYTSHTSKELFDFFKVRIPNEKDPRIEEILKQYNLQEYDEMELLKATKGIIMTDRYFLSES